MAVGDILDETIRLYRQQALVYVGVMALTFVPLSIVGTLTGAGIALSALLDPSRLTSLEFLLGAGVLILVFGVLYLVAFLLSQGTATVLASGGFLARPLQLLTALRTGAGHLLGLVTVSALLGVLVLAIAVADLALILGPVFAAPLPGLGLFALRVLAALAVGVLYYAFLPLRTPAVRLLAILATPFGAAVYCGVRWALCFQALLLEGVGPATALRRSWRLVDGYWWRTFVFLVLLAILVAILQYLPGVLLSIPLAFAEIVSQPGALESGLPITSLVLNLGSVLGWIIFGAVQWLAATVYYYDLRIRKEAFDLELEAQRMRAGMQTAEP
jgi:hypothetical protein